MEEWKIILTHPNYEVSNLGRVKNIITNRVKTLKPGKDGYIQTHLFNNGKSTTFMVHRLVAMYFLDNNKDKKYVNHIDAIRSNNSIDNLEWCTHSENMKHMVKLGNNIDHNGTNNPMSKFSEEEIISIREDDRVMSQIAKDFKVSQGAISNIKSGKTYKTSGGPIVLDGRSKNQVRGDSCGCSVVSEDIVKQIRYELKDMKQVDIAKKFNITKNIVYRIVHNISFKHI